MTESHPQSFAADIAEADEFLAAHPDTQYFDVFFTNLSGVPRGKRLRRQELLSLYHPGKFLPVSIQVVDINGNDVAETGLVWETGDPDRLAVPVPGGIVSAPWLGNDVGQVMTSLHELDRSGCALDPRRILQRVLDRYAADGLTPVVACELEFYLVDSERTADGGLQLAPSSLTGARPSAPQIYALDDLEDVSPFLRDLWAACDVQNIPLEGVISEASPGQFELTLTHKPAALRAADDAVMYKRVAKGVARAHGLAATFMAKPWAGQAGSGLHLHMSINDAAGNNLMAHDDPVGGPILQHAIGGMAKLLAESMAIFAPNANSYRRFRANSYAPVAPTWGVNNRTVALRIPAGPPSSRHVEHRVAGADANPYLALAAMLAAAHYGITHKIDPGPIVVGDGYAAAAKMGAKQPSNWFAAVEAFSRSEVLSDYLGEEFVRQFTIVKQVEQDRFFAQVGAQDYDWYLANA